MSRTYSKNRYRQSLREGWYDEEYVGRGRNGRWVEVSEERRKALCKRNACKKQDWYGFRSFAVGAGYVHRS